MGEYQILLMPPGHPITLLNLSSPNSDQHIFSPNNKGATSSTPATIPSSSKIQGCH